MERVLERPLRTAHLLHQLRRLIFVNIELPHRDCDARERACAGGAGPEEGGGRAHHDNDQSQNLKVSMSKTEAGFLRGYY